MKFLAFQCPGSVRIKEPIPEFFTCPTCGSEVEIWTHENSRKCQNCGKEVNKEHVPVCVEWCKYAKDCIGEAAYNKYMEGKKGAEKHGEKKDNQDR
jgi:hypothetical protein